MKMRNLLRLIAAGLVFFVLSSPLAHAVNKDTSLFDMRHTSWSAADGITGAVYAIAQTADGYLWLATEGGVLRFDGVRFQHLADVCKCNPIRGRARIWTSQSGILWILMQSSSSISQLSGSSLLTYERPASCSGVVSSMTEDLGKTVWLATTSGLCRLSHGKFEPVSPAAGLPRGEITQLNVDHQGRLWVALGSGALYTRSIGSPSFEKSVSGTQTMRLIPSEEDLAVTADGKVWEAGRGGLRQIYPGATSPFLEAQPRTRHHDPMSVLGGGTVAEGARATGSVIGDRENTLWVALAEGIVRLHGENLARVDTGVDPYKKEIFTTKDGLISDLIWNIFEDHEGNVWLGTSSGLQRFSDQVFTNRKLPAARQVQYVIAEDRAGSIWAATWNDHPLRLTGKETTSFPLFPRNTMKIYQAPHGDLWFAGNEGIWHGQGTSFSRVKDPPNPIAMLSVQFGEDHAGRLWMCAYPGGIFRFSGKDWIDENARFGLDPKSPGKFASDASGMLWFARKNSLQVIDPDGLTKTFTKTDGFPDDRVFEIQSLGHHLWLEGARDLVLFSDGVFRAIRSSHENSFASTNGVVEASNGDVWISGLAGIDRIDHGEVQRVLKDPSHLVTYDHFDASDGIIGNGSMLMAPHGLRAHDGLLWFPSDKGLVFVDPAKYSQQESGLLPPVAIQTLISDDIRHLPFEDVSLAPGVQHLMFEYAAITLTRPERVQYRYKLEGLDRQWQEAGVRRQAFYNDLGPGRYRFLVTACTSEGVCNNTDSSLSFFIQPAYYQTIWFRFLEVIVVAFAIWLLFAYRLRRASELIQSRLAERVFERERIARELHDGLLQGFHGIVLRFQVLGGMIPKGETASSVLEETLCRADLLMMESRARISDLRYVSESVLALPEALNVFAAQMQQLNGINFSASVVGSRQDLDPVVSDEMYFIGREALLNAFRHSKASAIEVEMGFDDSAVSIRIRDDGQGISSDVLRSKGSVGHWGLTGMHERAVKIGGSLKIWNRKNSGVELELRVPANLAYKRKERRSWWPRLTHRIPAEANRAIKDTEER